MSQTQTRFIRPEGEGQWGVYSGGSDPWHRKGTITAEGDGFRARFRDCDPGDLGLFDGITDAALAMIEAGREESRIIQGQVAYERAHGFSTD